VSACYSASQLSVAEQTYVEAFADCDVPNMASENTPLVSKVEYQVSTRYLDLWTSRGCKLLSYLIWHLLSLWLCRKLGDYYCEAECFSW